MQTVFANGELSPLMTGETAHQEKAFQDLIKLARKLRWIGMDSEAARIQARLMACDVSAGERPVAPPVCETD